MPTEYRRSPLTEADLSRYPYLRTPDRYTRAQLADLVMHATDAEVEHARTTPGDFGPDEMRALTATLKRLQSVLTLMNAATVQR